MGKTWDSVSSGLNFSDIENSIVGKFKNFAKNRIPNITVLDSIEKVFANLNLFDENKNLSNASILLFGKKPQIKFIAAKIRIGRFKASTEITDTIIIEGNLFEQLEAAIDAIKKHLNIRFEIKGIQRKDIWDYPIEVLREAVINALIHRDYSSSSEIQIKIYDDKIWLWNPGKLLPEITIEDLKKEHSSYPRNPLIANVFYLAGFIEKWGSGTKRMVELCKEQGLPEPEYREEQGGFSVYFFKDIYMEENLQKMGLNEREIRAILDVKAKGRITNKDYQKINKVSKPTATRELKKLVKLNLLIQKGITGKGTCYILSKGS